MVFNKIGRCFVMILALVSASVFADSEAKKAVTLSQLPQQECLGRLRFTLPEQFAWATSQAQMPMDSSASFTPSMFLYADSWRYNYILTMLVTEPTVSRTAFDSQWKAYMPRTIRLQKTKEEVVGWTDILESAKTTYQEQQEMKKRGEDIPKGWLITKEGIARAETALKEAQEKLYEMENRKIPQVPLAIADAYTINYGDQRAFVRRNERDYMFYFSTAGRSEVGIEPRPVTVDEVNQQLQQFETRELGSVPNKTGFCFPYGFLADNGDKAYEIKNSFRFTDQPNVAYTLYTGDNQFFGKGKFSRYGIRDTTAPQIVNPDEFTLTSINQTIELNADMSLELTGWNISENKPKDPEHPRHYYQAWGQIHSPQTANNRPFIVVQIYAFDKDEKDGRPHYAPAFDVAIERLKPVLSSIHIDGDTTLKTTAN